MGIPNHMDGRNLIDTENDSLKQEKKGKKNA
jgi:hypothetical protein